jgi:CRISPR system Cascade subunit CasC
MTRFLQLHFLTVYPPSNPNRDDTGRPKTAQFGGATRLRLSSQALKRSWRTSELFHSALEGRLGRRTQRLGREIEEHALKNGASPERAREIARAVADIFGKVKAENDADPADIEQLAFIGPEEREAALVTADELIAGHAVDLAKATSKTLRRADSAVDIAMFGRMLADDPDFNREAAVQVAHAITTHRVVVEDDYYTAVDDLKTAAEDAGAGFIGEAGFSAGLFYNYACIDQALLVKNLSGDEELAKRGIAALIEAAMTEAPRGKQASFASRPRCQWAMVERGDRTPRTLAAAYFKPVGDADILASSIARIQDLRERFADAYDDRPDHRIMDVTAGTGSMKALVAFATGGAAHA